MSQIAGILSVGGSDIAADELERLLAPLRRSPHDRERSWREGPIALAHLGLDVAGHDACDRQPAVSARDGTALVFEGRLFNRRELCDQLSGLRDRPLADTADSAIALEAWLRWGTGIPLRLVGDFAIAVWKPGERRLYLVRDRMGMRPLYYCHAGRRFAFASQIKGLCALPGLDLGLDEEWVAEYLSMTHFGRENTVYRGIRRLPAAHCMTVSGDGNVSVRRYWCLADEPAERFRADADYYAHLRELTRHVVEDRLPGTKPVASWLSGGLDSSTVTAFACRYIRGSGRPITAVSSVLPEDQAGPETDEREYIQAFLASYPECDWRPVTAPGKHALSDLDELLAICDHPVRDAYHYVTSALLAEARRRGARTVLTGLGGDLFLSSAASGAIARLVVQLRWGAAWRLLRRARAADYEQGLWRAVRSEVVAPFVLASPVAGLLERARLIAPRRHFIGAACADFSRRHGVARTQRYLERQCRSSPWRRLARTDAAIAESGVVAVALEYFAAMGTGFGLQLEVPLMDPRLVGAVAGLPARLRRDPATPRHLIREVGAEVVPDRIRKRRDKGPFSPDATRRTIEACQIRDELSGFGKLDGESASGSPLDWPAVRRTAASMTPAAGREQDAHAIVRIFSAASFATFQARRAAQEKMMSPPSPRAPSISSAAE